jgi:hypothetical protein
MCPPPYKNVPPPYTMGPWLDIGLAGFGLFLVFRFVWTAFHLPHIKNAEIDILKKMSPRTTMSPPRTGMFQIFPLQYRWKVGVS